MSKRWPIVVLAIGIALLYAAIALVIGNDTAVIVTAAAGIAYAVINVLSGKAQDDVEASRVLQRVFSVNRTTYAAIGLTWLSAITIFALPTVLSAVTAELRVTVRDEALRPIDAAQIRTNFDVTEISEKGSGIYTVKYYRFRAPTNGQVSVSSNENLVTVDLVKTLEGTFEDVTVPIWSGEQALRVSYFTAEGAAIQGVLEGKLPPDLERAFPRLRTVVPNEVYDVTAELIESYALFDAEWHSVEARYFDDRSTSRKNTETGYLLSGEYNAEAVWSEGSSLRDVRAMPANLHADFTDDILGHPTSQLLPEEFELHLAGPEFFFESSKATPSSETEALLSRFPDLPRHENGAVGAHLRKSLTSSDLQWLVENASLTVAVDPMEASLVEAQRLMSFFIENSIPTGFLSGSFSFDPYFGCAGGTPVHVTLDFPPPKLRFAIVENVGDRPIAISEFSYSSSTNVAIRSIGNDAELSPASISQETLAPREAVLLPVHIGFSNAAEDDYSSPISPSSDDVATFSFLPLESYPILNESGEWEYGQPANATLCRPSGIKLPSSSVFLPTPSPESFSDEREQQESAPMSHLVGPAIYNISYTVNGVRIPIRPDSGARIAMFGMIEGGSCPFVFVKRHQQEDFVNVGHVITNRSAPSLEGKDSVYLGLEFDEVQIRELEDEVSYLDQVALAVHLGGETTLVPARNPELFSDDGRYLVLRKGELINLEFDHTFSLSDQTNASYSLVVDGYYVPLSVAADSVGP